MHWLFCLQKYLTPRTRTHTYAQTRSILTCSSSRKKCVWSSAQFCLSRKPTRISSATFSLIGTRCDFWICLVLPCTHTIWKTVLFYLFSVRGDTALCIHMYTSHRIYWPRIDWHLNMYIYTNIYVHRIARARWRSKSYGHGWCRSATTAPWPIVK